MNVFISKATSNKNKIYHKDGCIYARKLKIANFAWLSKDEAIDRNYCECVYCGGLKGDFKVQEKTVNNWEKNNNIKVTYDKKTDTAYISTDNGFWKFYTLDEYGTYALYHRNVYNKDMSFYEAKNGDFHRQKDLKATYSLIEIINYVVEHDKAKAIIAVDYRKLPKQTKKQKLYYKQAANRIKRQSMRRVDSIFDMLEKKTPGFKELAFC